jgi:hypothetical protein
MSSLWYQLVVLLSVRNASACHPSASKVSLILHKELLQKRHKLRRLVVVALRCRKGWKAFHVAHPKTFYIIDREQAFHRGQHGLLHRGDKEELLDHERDISGNRN